MVVRKRLAQSHADASLESLLCGTNARTAILCDCLVGIVEEHQAQCVPWQNDLQRGSRGRVVDAVMVFRVGQRLPYGNSLHILGIE